jgi:3-phenylpropionate/trans-cinnamate dioxygenase ferredoxin subunit
MSWVAVCKVDELADDSAIRAEIDGTPVCVAKSGGELFAVQDVCSHAEVKLSEGEIKRGTVECWLHGSRFDLRTGKPTGLPATEPVPVYAVTAEDGNVLVSLEQFTS